MEREAVRVLEEQEPSSRERRVRILAALVVVVALAALVGGAVGIIDYLHPRDRIVNGGRIWRCALVGGSWPVDAAALVGLRDDLRMRSFGAVDRGDIWVAVVRLDPAVGGPPVEAGFVLGDSAGDRLGGLDHNGRAVAERASSEDWADHEPALAAARECLRRGLPA